MKYLLSFTLAATLFAQAPAANKVVPVEHAVPFGTVPGKLLLLGNSMVFYDDQQPESSFVVTRPAIEGLTAEGPTITVITRELVRNRSGEVRRLSFRVAAGGDPAPVTGWYASSNTTPNSATAPTSSSASDTNSYPVRHDKRFGGSTGRLLILDDMLSYESVSDVKSSRRWEYRSIKEIRQSNPYELEVKPFTGDSYNFKLEGTGMDPAAFKKIVDRVTAARTAR